MRWRFEVQRVPTAMGMVRSGLGLTVLPRSGLDAHGIGGLVGVPLRNPSVARRLGIMSLRERPLPPPAALLARLVTDRVKGLGAGGPRRTGVFTPD